jgi:hypothetical protein
MPNDTETNTDTPPAPPLDPFLDDTPIVASCDLANPESCESCQ